MHDITLTYFLLFCLGAICSVPFLVRIKKRQNDNFEIIYWVTAYFLLIFVFRSVYLLRYGSLFLGQPPFSEEIISSWNISLIYLFISFSIFLIGYYSKIGIAIANVMPSLSGRWSSFKAKIFIVFSIVVSIISYLVLLQYLGGFSYYFSHKGESLTIPGTGYFNFGIWFLNYALVVGLIFFLKYKKFKKITFLLLFPLTLIIGFLRGSKLVFLAPILMVVVVYHYFKKNIKMKYIVIFLLLTVLLVPVLDINRGTANLSDFFSRTLNTYNPLKSIRVFMDRFHDMDSLIYIIKDTPRVMDYQLGKTIMPIFVSWIPRRFWPEKPVISFGRVFGESYYGEFWTSKSGAASATIIGEAYINFHIAGILLVSLLFGIMIRFFYQYLIKNNFGEGGLFIYASIFYQLFMFWESDFGTAITGLMFSLFLTFSISLLLSKENYYGHRN